MPQGLAVAARYLRPAFGAEAATEGHMTLTNLGLWIVLLALLALIPCGCVFTRPRKHNPAATES
jgi:hypothetical protein